MRDLGVLARSAREEQGLTQAEVAQHAGVGRDVVIRFEQGHPRLEAQRVLDILAALQLVLNVGAADGVETDRTSGEVDSGVDDGPLYGDTYTDTYRDTY